MPYNYLPHYNESLAENPELSSHNKEVLDDFVEKMEARGTKKSAIGDYISRYNTLTPKINFPLDEPTQAQITKLAGDINKDRVERQRGTVNFSDDSKIKFIKTVKTFYRQFIKKPGEGYIDEVDGKRLVDDFKPQTKKEKDEDEDQIDLNEIPTTKKAASGEKLQLKCLILFSWGLGARKGEIFQTGEQ